MTNPTFHFVASLKKELIDLDVPNPWVWHNRLHFAVKSFFSKVSSRSVFVKDRNYTVFYNITLRYSGEFSTFSIIHAELFDHFEIEQF